MHSYIKAPISAKAKIFKLIDGLLKNKRCAQKNSQNIFHNHNCMTLLCTLGHLFTYVKVAKGGKPNHAYENTYPANFSVSLKQKLRRFFNKPLA